MVALNLTSMQLTAVKYVIWEITLLTNHWGVITILPIRNEGQIWLYLIPIGAARSVNWPPLPEVFFPSQETEKQKEKKTSGTQGSW